MDAKKVQSGCLVIMFILHRCIMNMEKNTFREQNIKNAFLSSFSLPVL